MALDIGRIAYQAYLQSLSESSITDFVHASWEQLGKMDQDAWRSAAVAISQYLGKAKEDMKNGI